MNCSPECRVSVRHKWWSCFLSVWNGKELMSRVTSSGPPVMITSDASGMWGCGAFTSMGEWFQLELPETWSDIHITVKELLPIVLGVSQSRDGRGEATK